MENEEKKGDAGHAGDRIEKRPGIGRYLFSLHASLTYVPLSN